MFDDADIPSAVSGIVAAGFFNAGQDCTAATRLLVQEASTTSSSRPSSPRSASNARTGPDVRTPRSAP